MAEQKNNRGRKVVKKIKLKRSIKRKIKTFSLILVIALVGGGIFLNSSYYNGKMDSVYAQLKEEHNIGEEKTEQTIEVAQSSDNQSVESTERRNEEVTSRGTKETRNTEQIVWDYLRKAGYSEIQTAAIIGNLWQESRMNPSLVEYTNKEGIGLVQWSYGRKAQLIQLAESKGKDWTDLDTQLEFLVSELRSGRQFLKYEDMFKNPYSIDDAVYAYCFGFERPNAEYANLSYRKAMAWKAYYRNVNR